ALVKQPEVTDDLFVRSILEQAALGRANDPRIVGARFVKHGPQALRMAPVVVDVPKSHIEPVERPAPYQPCVESARAERRTVAVAVEDAHHDLSAVEQPGPLALHEKERVQTVERCTSCDVEQMDRLPRAVHEHWRESVSEEPCHVLEAQTERHRNE